MLILHDLHFDSLEADYEEPEKDHEGHFLNLVKQSVDLELILVELEHFLKSQVKLLEKPVSFLGILVFVSLF